LKRRAIFKTSLWDAVALAQQAIKPMGGVLVDAAQFGGG
jgi:hypothetical protein